MEPFLGEIRQFAFDFVPTGWAQCDGTVLPIPQYAALFALIGNYYGGDGKTNFALPDLRGRTPMHVGVDSTGHRVNLAEKAGSEGVTVTMSQLPVHTHSVQANSVAGTSASPTNNVWAVAKTTAPTNTYGTTGDTAMSTGALASAGTAQPHENRQPFLVVNFCIATQGVFPSRP